MSILPQFCFFSAQWCVFFCTGDTEHLQNRQLKHPACTTALPTQGEGQCKHYKHWVSGWVPSCQKLKHLLLLVGVMGIPAWHHSQGGRCELMQFAVTLCCRGSSWRVLLPLERLKEEASQQSLSSWMSQSVFREIFCTGYFDVHWPGILQTGNCFNYTVFVFSVPVAENSCFFFS